jgi:hypothetical protein
MMRHSFRKISVIIFCAIAGISIAPASTNAQENSLAAGATSCAVGTYISSKITSAVSGLFSSSVSSAVSGAVPTNSAFENKKLAAQEDKNFTLDRLASCAAKQLLHQMTADTISWINTGFRGGPAFLQNPRGFLLDTADQLTGRMIGNDGLLQGLCSPWSVDIRLKLALETTSGGFDNRRYTCTLDTIIGQAKNATLNGFIGGDFRQGGWRAFMEMTAGSQNPAAQYLLAKSQLQSAINEKTKEINDDLAQGMGFLSSEKCTEVAYDEIGVVNPGEILTSVGDENSNYTHTQCVKTTPGSVIAHALNVHTDSGIVESELANDINSVTSALFTQLTNQLLQKGLAGLSGSGSSNIRLSGRTNLNSAINQLQAAAYAPQTVTSGGSTYTVQNGSVTQAAQTPASQVSDTYATALTLLTATKTKYAQARDCFAKITIANNPADPDLAEAQKNLAAVNSIITNQIDPLLASTTLAQNSVVPSDYMFADISKAQSALVTAQVKSSLMGPDANSYLTACQNMNGTN